MVRAILFDMDGLMIDTEPIFWEVARELAGRHGRSVGDSTLRNMMGRSRLDAMRVLIHEASLEGVSSEQLLVEREDLLLDHYRRGVSAMPGVVEIVHAFHGRLKRGVVTSSPRRFTDVLLPAIGIDGCFDVIQTGDDIDRGKPDPEIYLRAIERLDVRPGECIVLEDSRSGALAGHRAGAFVIAVPSPLTIDEDFSFADARVQSLPEAQRLIESKLQKA